jgi:predicted RNA-binding Zn-ribbon protein involved in translation (DUF1610 family)
MRAWCPDCGSKAPVLSSHRITPTLRVGVARCRSCGARLDVTLEVVETKCPGLKAESQPERRKRPRATRDESESTIAERRQLALEMLLDSDQSISNGRVAEAVGLAPATVGRVRARAIADGMIDDPPTRMGRDGKKYPNRHRRR